MLSTFDVLSTVKFEHTDQILAMIHSLVPKKEIDTKYKVQIKYEGVKLHIIRLQCTDGDSSASRILPVPTDLSLVLAIKQNGCEFTIAGVSFLGNFIEILNNYNRFFLSDELRDKLIGYIDFDFKCGLGVKFRLLPKVNMCDCQIAVTVRHNVMKVSYVYDQDALNLRKTEEVGMKDLWDAIMNLDTSESEDDELDEDWNNRSSPNKFDGSNRRGTE